MLEKLSEITKKKNKNFCNVELLKIYNKIYKYWLYSKFDFYIERKEREDFKEFLNNKNNVEFIIDMELI